MCGMVWCMCGMVWCVWYGVVYVWYGVVWCADNMTEWDTVHLAEHVQHDLQHKAQTTQPQREATPLCVGKTRSSARHPLVHKEHLAAVE